MIEREPELAELAAALAEAASGGVRVVALQGVTGTGRSALLGEFGARAGGAGARVLQASGAPSESSLSWGIVRQLLTGAGVARDGTAVVRELLDHEVLARAEHDGVSRSRVLDGLSTAVLEWTGQGPVVIAIDDTQYLDAFSQDWLIYLIRRAGRARLLVVLGWRDDDAETCPGNSQLLCAEFHRQPYLRRRVLAPLSAAGVAQVLAARWSGPVPGDLAARAHQLTGGNLSLLQALLADSRAASGGDGPPAELVTGVEFTRAVHLVLGRCDQVTLRVAGAIAVLGERSRFAVLDRLVGATPQRVAAAVARLARIGLLEAGRMRHPIMAAAVLDTFPAAERSELSRRAADLLKAGGADPVTIAEHFVAAGRVEDPSAVPSILEGAQQALAENRSGRAAELLRLGYQLDADGRYRTEILALLLRASWREDLRASVGHLSELTEAMRAGTLRGRHATMPVVMLLVQGRVEEASSALARLVDDLPPGSRPPWELEMVRTWLAQMYPGVIRGDAGENPAGPPIVPQSAISYRLLEHFRTAQRAAEPGGRGDEALWQQPLTEITLLPLVLALRTLVRAERLDEAEQRCRVLMQTCLELKAPTWRAVFCAIAAQIALHRGSLDVAASRAGAALDLVPLTGWGVLAADPLSTLLTAQTLQGRHDDAARTLARQVPDATFQTPFGLSYLLARGRHYVGRGLPQVALDDFRAVADLSDRWGIGDADLLPWRTEMAAAHLHLGDLDTAARYAGEQLHHLGTDGHLRIRGRTLRLLAATREPRRRPPVLRTAVDVLRRSGDTYELAAALTALRDIYTRLGDTGRARSVARRANHLRRAARADASVPPAAAPGNTVDLLALSDAERRVATFAGKGLTNREIAGSLYLTTSTVEQHLTRIYRKLGVTSRVQLLSRLALQVTDA
ncbi:helix-turn-helix transcriptional regulator [Pseudonocardia sp. HH130630-07]|uniref:helix-turn-helix transcriptional regulator n=1 Tax=Pseudonocardia sp. HH130630-07 TaxID=1690815 RepID=UPI000814CB1C|nr:AAA family ATPase [Pseudonocardia sp. HH130630-07]ANY08007.1 LuxR family transcriptional regulator [Pseudonocardia sp. HH130630-07]